MLDYTHTGVAKVKVEYVGRARMDGDDEQYLMASYRPGRDADPSDGLPTGVMVAMNGSTPGGRLRSAVAAVPNAIVDAFTPDEPQYPAVAEAPLESAPVAYQPGSVELPAFGPIFPDRPENGIWPAQEQQVAAGLMSYADSRVKAAASSPFDMLQTGSRRGEEVRAAWKRQNPDEAGGEESYVAVGTFADEAEATRVARALQDAGRVTIEMSQEGDASWYAVSVRTDGRLPVDGMLEAAWANGAPDALIVRN
jgi:rare lipoprotein A